MAVTKSYRIQSVFSSSQLKEEVQNLSTERNILQIEKEGFIGEINTLNKENSNLTLEKENLINEKNELILTNNTLIEENKSLKEDKIVILDLSDSNIENINERRYEGYIALEEVILPSVFNGEIKDYCFKDCKNLRTITGKIKSIGFKSFSGCTSLTNISASFTNVSNNAFENCTSLYSLNLENVEYLTLEDLAFTGCTKLTTVTLPKVLYLENYIFSGCSNLVEIYYAGTKNEWNNISKTDSWYVDSSITTIICTDGTITL